MKPAAWRVGAFAVVGLAALVLAVVLAGGRWFAPTERAVMRFDSSVYGLQAGAPVVFRGVRLGLVQRIGLGPSLAVPVQVEFEHQALKELLGAVQDKAASGSAIQALIAQGLVARLATQSLLTGQLYVDLDMQPGPAVAVAMQDGLPLIPTAPTQLQNLQAQLAGLQDLDLAQMSRDVAAVAAAARRLLDGPEPARALKNAADAALAVESLVASLQTTLPRLDRLTRHAEITLTAGQLSLQQLGQAAQQVAAAASQVQTLASHGQPLVEEVQRGAAELARAARALGSAADADSALRLNAERALQDVSRAARALAELGETLERQPDALWRGRAAPVQPVPAPYPLP